MITFQTLWKENLFIIYTPLSFGNLPLSHPYTSWNFHDPRWGGYGYFLEPHNGYLTLELTSKPSPLIAKSVIFLLVCKPVSLIFYLQVFQGQYHHTFYCEFHSGEGCRKNKLSVLYLWLRGFNSIFLKFKTDCDTIVWSLAGDEYLYIDFINFVLGYNCYQHYTASWCNENKTDGSKTWTI